MSRRRAPLAVFTTIAVTAATLTASTSPVSAATITFTSAADTYVDNSATGTNYGTSSQLGVDNSPAERLFLQFTVSGLSGPVSGAKLRIHTDDVSGAESHERRHVPVDVQHQLVGDRRHLEQPARHRRRHRSARSASVARNAWYEVDVTSRRARATARSASAPRRAAPTAPTTTRGRAAPTAPQLVVTTGDHHDAAAR